MKLVMAAIVATLLLPPLAGVAWLACRLLGASFESLVTFGGALGAPSGITLWWGLLFVPALVYALVIRQGL
ncbi:MAG TPA: hypothetical protein VFC18_06050 [Burkholderiales bacterium]|nr:hypothetical protein [Burkholderiales bacterium]